jgi:hypothetical protein
MNFPLEKKMIAVIGSGYWGKNLVGNYHDLACLSCGKKYQKTDSGLEDISHRAHRGHRVFFL